MEYNMSAAFDELLDKYIDLKTKYDNLLLKTKYDNLSSNKIFLSEPAPFDSGAPAIERAIGEAQPNFANLDSIASPFRASVKL